MEVNRTAHRVLPRSTILLSHQADSLGAAFAFQDAEERWLVTMGAGRQSRMSRTNPEKLLSMGLRSAATALCYGIPRNMILLGLGGGEWVRFMAHHWPKTHIEAVEYRPMIYSLAHDFFEIRGIGNPKAQNLDVCFADARAFVASPSRQPVDLILVDLFDGMMPPEFLATGGFWRDLAGHLAPTGMVVVNVAGPAEFQTRVRAALGDSFPRSGWMSAHQTVGNRTGIGFMPGAPTAVPTRAEVELLANQTGLPLVAHWDHWIRAIDPDANTEDGNADTQADHD